MIKRSGVFSLTAPCFVLTAPSLLHGWCGREPRVDRRTECDVPRRHIHVIVVDDYACMLFKSTMHKNAAMGLSETSFSAIKLLLTRLCYHAPSSFYISSIGNFYAGYASRVTYSELHLRHDQIFRSLTQ